MASPLVLPMVIPPSTLSRWKSVGYGNLDENRNSHTFHFMHVPGTACKLNVRESYAVGYLSSLDLP